MYMRAGEPFPIQPLGVVAGKARPLNQFDAQCGDTIQHIYMAATVAKELESGLHE